MKSYEKEEEKIDSSLEIDKIKMIIEELIPLESKYRSFVSYYVSSQQSIADCLQLLTNEYARAINFKRPQTRNSVLRTIDSIKLQIEQYPVTPINGLAIFFGEILDDEDQTVKEYNYFFEPFKPIKESMYKCGELFDTSLL